MTSITIEQVAPEVRANWRSRRTWWKPWTWLRRPFYVGPVRTTYKYVPLFWDDKVV